MIFTPKEVVDKKGDTCIFRSLDPGDADELMRFVEQGSQESPYFPWAPGETDLTASNVVEYISEFKNDERRLLLGVFMGSRLIGLEELSNYGKWKSMRHRCTSGTALLKEAQGRGLGKKVTLAVIDVAREIGYEQIESSVATDNEASTANLLSMGYEEYGMIPHKKKDENGLYVDERRFVKWL